MWMIRPQKQTLDQIHFVSLVPNIPCILTSQYIDGFQMIFVIFLSAGLYFSFAFSPQNHVSWVSSQLSLQSVTCWDKENYTMAT